MYQSFSMYIFKFIKSFFLIRIRHKLFSIDFDVFFFFFFSSRRRHTRYWRDWSSDVCSSDLLVLDQVWVSPQLSFCLKGAFPVFTIANSDRVAHGRQKDLAIPDFSRFCCFQDRLDCWLHALVREHHLDLDLWQ